MHEIVYTAQVELNQRTAKYLERTDKVYKPSQTIEFNREGELLLFSCENIKHSTLYFKYPYFMYDLLLPIMIYNFFVNPLMLHWWWTCLGLYGSVGFSWLPHAMYWKSLDKKIHKIFLLRGGKYVRIWTQNPMGDRFYSWAHICDFNLLTEGGEDFVKDADEEDLMTRKGQLKYEVEVQLDHYMDHSITVQDQIISFMTEGNVNQPEIFEQVLKGYNIDTSDFTINTEHSIRFHEPNLNY